MTRIQGTKNKKRSSLEVYIETNPLFEVKDDFTHCRLCDIKLATDTYYGKKSIMAHEKTKKHVANLEHMTNKYVEGKSEANLDAIHKRLTSFFVHVGMPLSILDRNVAKAFLRSLLILI